MTNRLDTYRNILGDREAAKYLPPTRQGLDLYERSFRRTQKQIADNSDIHKRESVLAKAPLWGAGGVAAGLGAYLLWRKFKIKKLTNRLVTDSIARNLAKKLPNQGRGISADAARNMISRWGKSPKNARAMESILANSAASASAMVPKTPSLAMVAGSAGAGGVAGGLAGYMGAKKDVKSAVEFMTDAPSAQREKINRQFMRDVKETGNPGKVGQAVDVLRNLGMLGLAASAMV